MGVERSNHATNPPQLQGSHIASGVRFKEPSREKLTQQSTGLSKRNDAKFRELSQNFPKFADWAVHGRSLCRAAVGARIFKQGTIILHKAVDVQFITDSLRFINLFIIKVVKFRSVILCILYLSLDLCSLCILKAIFTSYSPLGGFRI